MKRLITLLLLTIAAFGMRSEAQTSTACNAQFSFNLVTGTTVHFVPVAGLDSNLTVVSHHSWSFGDGTSAATGDPNHTYANCGTYSVKHIYWKTTPNGTICSDTIVKPVIVQCPSTTCNVHASYSYHRDSIHTNLVYFTNLSTPAGDIHFNKWSFGDGTYSTDLNPTHTYSTSGLYTVCLEVRKDSAGLCKDDTCIAIQIQVSTSPVCNLQAYFTWTADSLQLNRIYFHNQTVNFVSTDTIRWNFGDGSAYSYDVNPTHVYAQSGNYNVCIRVSRHTSTGAPCVSEICKTVIVAATNTCNLVADFSSHPDSVQTNKIYFHNLSVPFNAGDSIKWTFGDGTVSYDVNPTHIYTTPGSYTVCIRVKKNNTTVGSVPCVKEICKSVMVVINNCNFQPSFTSHADSVNHKKIYFTNTTSAPNATSSASWTFGDGTSATGWNAVHEYAQAGKYYVCLRVEAGPNCVRYKCDSITVTGNDPSCNDLAKFTYQALSTNYLTYKFTPDFQNSALQYVWSFGDGAGSNNMLTDHHYAQAGVYHVCLTVYRNNTCVNTVCKELRIVPQIICDSIHVSYISVKDAYAPNKYYFYAISNFPLLQQRWTFTRLSPTPAPAPIVTYENNPIHVFGDTGVYRVCLRAITFGGCIKEYCDVIHVTQTPTPQCQLQAYPNPASNVINVNVQLQQPEMIHAYVYNALNILVKEQHTQGMTGNNVVTIPVANLTAGWYTIKLIYGNKTCYARFQKI